MGLFQMIFGGGEDPPRCGNCDEEMKELENHQGRFWVCWGCNARWERPE